MFLLPNNNANLRGRAQKKLTTPVKGKEIIDNDNELADDDAHLADSDVFFDLMQKPVETERKQSKASQSDQAETGEM